MYKRQELIKLIRALYFNREEKHRSGKKFYLSDERIMKEAETILHEEFAHVLNICLLYTSMAGHFPATPRRVVAIIPYPALILKHKTPENRRTAQDTP